MKAMCPLSITLSSTLALVGCQSDDGVPPGSDSIALTRTHACFTTDTGIVCVEPDSDEERDELRIKVEDFYPSACFDGDHDSDGTPDFLDVDFLASEFDADVEEDELRCPRCNRGPGTQNDFRLEVSGDLVELDRGKIFVGDDTTVEVPTIDGILTVHITDQTELDLDHGPMGPGAEIRVHGTVDGISSIAADELRVLCPGPVAIDDDEVPPDAEPPSSDDDEPVVL